MSLKKRRKKEQHDKMRKSGHGIQLVLNHGGQEIIIHFRKWRNRNDALNTG